MNSNRIVYNKEEIFLINYEGRNIVYVPLRGVILEVNSIASKMLADGGNVESEIIKEIYNTILRYKKNEVWHNLGGDSTIFEPYAIGLCLTNKCNLSCLYCHANSKWTGNKLLNWTRVKSAIDFGFHNAVKCNKCLEITFPGTGEPTLNWNMLVRAVEYTKKVAINHVPGYKISMSTNGYFTLEQAKYIKNNFSGLSLSLDGPEDIHNYQRPYKNGEGTFKVVFDTAKYFFKCNFLFSIRATITEYSVNRMKEIWDFFQEKFPGVPAGLERMNPLGRGQNSKLRPPEISVFNSNFIEILKNGSKDKNILLNSGVGKLNFLRTSFCKSLSYPCMTITPDGNITACQRDGSPAYFYYGLIDEYGNIKIDLQKINYFRTLRVDKFIECEDCFSKYHCAGDCFDLRRAKIKRCLSNKRILISDIICKLDNNQSITAVTPDDPRYRKISKKLHHF